MGSSVYYQDRKFITVSGPDSRDFLQGLITNDINKLEKERIIFSALLTAKGRFLYDFYIWKSADGYLIDISNKFADQLLKKLKLYKIRKDVALDICSGYKAAIVFPEMCVTEEGLLSASDPRKADFATRVLITGSIQENRISSHREASSDEYNSYRIKHLIAEGDQDLEQEKSIILEYGYNQQNAISYDKGCYLGQELITRTHRVGVIRKKLVSFAMSKQIDVPYDVEVSGKKKASITSKANLADEAIYLALVREGYDLTKNDFTNL